MILWPAVDIRDGHAVRLTGGEFHRETIYDADPLDAARRWLDDGALALHVVDLDGARDGAPANLHHVARIVQAANVPVQVGGGLRDADAVARVLAAGADRAILGTAALGDPGFAERMVAAHGSEKIVVSVDARGGRVAAAGWTEQTDELAEETLQSLMEVGVRRFVYSSIERDGMLAGPDLEGVRRIVESVEAEIVYSGGVRSAADLADLAALREPSLAGVIVGTALFQARLTVAEGQAALDGGER
jgi:phosphoribosylformimino-5-aminoimidazole carboxamide ribotide isomerase